MPFRFPKNVERYDGVPLRDAVQRTGRARARVGNGLHSAEVIHHDRGSDLFAWGDAEKPLPHPANHNQVAWLSERQVTDTFGDRWFPAD